MEKQPAQYRAEYFSDEQSLVTFDQLFTVRTTACAYRCIPYGLVRDLHACTPPESLPSHSPWCGSVQHTVLHRTPPYLITRPTPWPAPGGAAANAARAAATRLCCGAHGDLHLEHSLVLVAPTFVHAHSSVPDPAQGTGRVQT